MLGPPTQDASTMGRFKSKEEYLQWAEKRKARLQFQAALIRACKETVRSLFKAKTYTNTKFVFSACLILILGLLFSLPFLKVGKKGPPSAGRGSPHPRAEAVASHPAAGKSAGDIAGVERATHSLEDLLPKARRTAVLVKSPQGSGSGFLLPQPGLVAACAHTLGRSDDAEVFLPSGAVKRAVVLKRLPMPVDVAFLRVEDPGGEWEPMPDSDRCQEGEDFLAVGVLGRDRSRPDLALTKGKILRCDNPYQGVQYIQVDRDIHPAAIGGPVLNARGEILGMALGELTGTSLAGARYGLAIQVVKGLMDQKLAHLEERAREKERFFKSLQDDLGSVLSAEQKIYQKKLSDLHEKGALSAQEAARLERRGLQPPSGQSSMKDWVADLAERVIRGELTKEQASARIKAHYDL